jgi:phosphoribosylformimino-5-aminoimidazole carboxamide ribotide isomerase
VPTEGLYHRDVEIIPAIDIRGGRCVRLVQGDYSRETVYGDDPVAMARRWAEAGARRLHVVDLDGAKDRRPVNRDVILRIVEESGVPVQVAGGMGDPGIVQEWLVTEVDRVVVGTLAVERADDVAKLIAAAPERIAIAVDARDGVVATKGWLSDSGIEAPRFIEEMASIGARRFIYTDISRDGTLDHADTQRAASAAARVRRAVALSDDDVAPLIFSGGITSIEDIIALADLGIEGVISGKALYDGRIDLREAMRALAVGDDW